MKYQYLLIAFVISGCSPKVVTNLKNTAPKTPLQQWEPFIISEGESIIEDKELIGSIEIKDAALSWQCDYETIKKIAEGIAREMGGNYLHITEHKFPDVWSTCHRLKGQVYHIKETSLYEKEISWHKNRPLQIEDFKGTIQNRPFQAATYSTIFYNFYSKPGFDKKKYFLEVNTRFDCVNSYFKPSEYDSMVLSHEQVHFDITELFARRFIQRMQSEAPTLKLAMEKHQEIYTSIFNELQLKQDEFDTEVYDNEQHLIKWQNWVIDKLNETSQFEARTYVVNPK